MKIALRTPLRYRTARHQVALRLYTDLVDEALLAQRYDASVAGFSYSLGLNEEGLILTLTGWTSDKLLDLLRTIVMTMTSVHYAHILSDCCD
jgi:secreted Zn-dependent insulinase-like peptidase